MVLIEYRRAKEQREITVVPRRYNVHESTYVCMIVMSSKKIIRGGRKRTAKVERYMITSRQQRDRGREGFSISYRESLYSSSSPPTSSAEPSDFFA